MIPLLMYQKNKGFICVIISTFLMMITALPRDSQIHDKPEKKTSYSGNAAFRR